MPFPDIPTPPTPPDRNDPVNFNSDAAAWADWVNSFATVMQSWTYIGNALTGVTGSYTFTDGAVATPSITFAADNDTGFCRLSANALAMVTGGTEAMRVTSGQNFVIGGDSPISLSGNPRLNIQGRTTASSTLAVMRESADANSPTVALVKSRGTGPDDYTIVQTGDSLGALSFAGADGAAAILSARISAQVIGTPALGDVRGQLNFWTGSGAGTAAIRVSITDTKVSSNLPILVSSGGIGYDTGNGGTVTQATSRTTGVTLSKVCGEVTLFSAAGSASVQSFVVTNSQVAASDIVVLNVKSSTNVYRAWVSAKAAGQFTVSFVSESGTATDAPVFGFAVVRAVNS